MDDRRSTAIHEAGHAVIGYVLDMGSMPTTIEPDEVSSGHVVTEDPWDTVDRWDREGISHGAPFAAVPAALRARCLMLMAGAEAEQECLGQCAGGDGNDRRQITLILNDILDDDVDLPRYAGRLRSMAQRMVRRHRPAIERVAALLIECRRLGSVEIDRAIRGL